MAKCSLCDVLCEVCGLRKKEWVFPADDVHCQQLLVESLLHAIDKSAIGPHRPRARLPARVPTRRVARQMVSEVGFVDGRDKVEH